MSSSVDDGQKLGIVGAIGRFKPLHHGGAVMLEALCEQADHVIIGIGSSNKYNARNPFTPEETKEMIDAYLSPRFSNYSVIFVPDFAHIPEYRDGQRWKEYVVEHYGKLDHFVSGDAYVRELLAAAYDVVHPATLVAPEKRVPLRGTEVRLEMAKGGNWKDLVPGPVATYLENKGLVERFQREFGLATLTELATGSYHRNESPAEEKAHTMEV